MEQNFQKLEELIKDDDKIVTVASFAFEANISIDESKQVIEKYAEINKGSHQVNITYVLNGRKTGEEKLSISLIKGDILEEEKALYEEGVKHIIFSIQKAKNIDYNVIALVDPVSSKTEKDPLSGALVGKNCIKRVLRKKVLPAQPPATVKGKSTIFTKQNSTVKSENTKVEKDIGDSNQSNKNKGSTQGNIASLFSKAAQNKKIEQKDGKQQKANVGLSNFFTRQPSKDLTTKVQNNEIKKENQNQKETKSTNLNVNETEKNKNSKQDKKEKIPDSDTDDGILKNIEIKEEKPSKKNERAKTSQKKDKKADLFDSDTEEEILKDLEIKEEKLSEKTSGKKREQVKSNQNKSKRSQKNKRGKSDVGNDKSVKKRKRIIVEDESDSDDIFGSEKSDSEDVIEKSDEEPEAAKKEKKPLPPKNKRRKAVEKIYEDEDGYIVTKTEYVYETPSEDENEPENKIAKVEEKPKPKIENKASSNSENDITPNKGSKSKKAAAKKAPAGNQPTLMNFFKKK